MTPLHRLSPGQPLEPPFAGAIRLTTREVQPCVPSSARTTGL